MDPIRILCWEGLAFLCVLAALLFYRMLTRQIHLAGLLGGGRKDGGVTPERVQFLVITIAVSCNILRTALHGRTNALPQIGTAALAIFGASSLTYLGTKAFRMFKPGSGLRSSSS